MRVHGRQGVDLDSGVRAAPAFMAM